MRRAGDRGTRPAAAGADDADVIKRSWLEPEEFAVLFDRHARRIHRYAARRAGPEAADDVVAGTFLVAFGKRRAYDLRHRDALPWLYGIATNLIGQHRREEARQFRLQLSLRPEPGVPGHAEQVAADVTVQATRGLLVAALARLAAPDRDVLLLIAWEQLTYPEVSRSLGIPVGTVRSRLHRARAQVREALAQAGSPPTLQEMLSND